MNDFTGSKYAETYKLDLAEIAKLVRKDIKAAVKASDLPKGLKASVRISRYSNGQSLRCTIKECPGIVIANPERVRFDLNNPLEFTTLPLLSPDAAAILRKVKKIVNSYNRDKSELETDYWDVKFYAFAEFCTDLETQSRDEIKIRFVTETEALEAAGRISCGLRSIGWTIERQEQAA